MIKSELNPECGKRLKQCLEEISMTQSDLADLSGFTQQYISNIVVGKKPMTVKAAKEFASVLNVREEYLLCEDEVKTDNDFWGKRHKLFDDVKNVSLQLLHLAGYEPICDFIKNWTELGLDKKVYGPFAENDTAGKHIPDSVDGEIELCTEIATPNGKKFYADYEDIQLLSYELMEYIHFRMKQLESKYAWKFDDGHITLKSPGSEIIFYEMTNAAQNPDFLCNSIWLDHDDDDFPDIKQMEDYTSQHLK